MTTDIPTHLQAEADYIEAYFRAHRAMRGAEAMLHDMPAPGGEVEITWGHVGDMHRIAAQAEEILAVCRGVLTT